MFIIIKDNYQIIKQNLSNRYEYKGIEIYAKKDNYYISLKDKYYFSDNTKSKLLEIKKYEINCLDTCYLITIYVYKDDCGIDDFKLYAGKQFFIAYNEKANIFCKDKHLTDSYLYIGDSHIKTNFEICVNGLMYNDEPLKQGDVIDYLGIKIFYYEDFIYINSFNIVSKINEYNPQTCALKYPNIVSAANYHIARQLIPIKIQPIDKYEAIKKPNISELIKSLVPNIVMSLSMLALAYISISNSILNNQSQYSRVSYILMPISMCLTGIFIPIIFYVYDNHKYKKEYQDNKNKYLAYLKQYEDNLEKDISEYLNSHNSRYFDLSDFKQKMFSVNKNSDDFLNISIGKIIVSQILDYKLSDDGDINEYLKKINNRAMFIEDYPLLVDLKENRIISIVTKPSCKEYFFNKFLLELSYKHHYDDINIAIYSKNSDIYNNAFNLPHLFINDKRLTLNSDKQLQELDQSKLDKPLVLFIYDHIQFNFSNKNIYILYFTSDNTDLYKNGKCVVEYLNNKGYLYTDKKQEFSFIEQRINFNDYFAYLGRLRLLEKNNLNIHFKDVFTNEIAYYYQHSNNTLESSFAYSNGELLNFDLHETKQGPHGLIGGCTGSGKSELIVSLLLSLCIRYSPEYLNIVLIDYKGGGIKESLSFEGISIPHISASVTNLENNTLERLIICLNNECKQRQELFKSLSRLTNSSIMNLDDYLAQDYQQYHLRKLAHLLIVVDEFAELKKNNPEIIKELISLSRIGRSLGLHLILATQKPSGVIDEEIWSNSHFKIALKVFEEKDSQDLIKRKDAAYLNTAGSFLLQVDDSLIEAQSIYSKADINGNDPCKVSLLDNTLSIKKTTKLQVCKNISEATFYSSKIIDTCKKFNLKANTLDFLPASSKSRKLLTTSPCLVFGQSDDYLNSKRSVVSYDIKDNILLYSSRPKEICSFLNTLNENKRQTIVIAKDKYSGPYISDSILYDDSDDIDYLFDYLLSNKNLNISLVIEDINCLLSYDETYLDKLCKLARRSDTLNISLLFITSNSQISFKLINYFNIRVLINANEVGDISSFYGMRPKYIGHSFYFDNEPISMVPIKLENYVSSPCLLEPVIQRIPDIIQPCIENDLYLIGYDLRSKQKVMSDNNITIYSLDETLLDEYSKAYKDFKTILYSYDTKPEINNSILWLGPGIFNQRLFIASLKDDLRSNEALYIANGRKQLLRSIDDV